MLSDPAGGSLVVVQIFLFDWSNAATPKGAAALLIFANGADQSFPNFNHAVQLGTDRAQPTLDNP
jgi:hypothetical protein